MGLAAKDREVTTFNIPAEFTGISYIHINLISHIGSITASLFEFNATKETKDENEIIWLFGVEELRSLAGIAKTRRTIEPLEILIKEQPRVDFGSRFLGGIRPDTMLTPVTIWNPESATDNKLVSLKRKDGHMSDDGKETAEQVDYYSYKKDGKQAELVIIRLDNAAGHNDSIAVLKLINGKLDGAFVRKIYSDTVFDFVGSGQELGSLVRDNPEHLTL